LKSEPEDDSLAGFLDTVALYTDLDSTADSDNVVTMMTMHSAKGLEFPNVYVAGMEEGLFPGSRAIGESEEMEEERRLCYVAMTRAKERLIMTTARQRMLYGRTTSNMPSRFLEEVPSANSEWQGKQGSAMGGFADRTGFEGGSHVWSAPTRRAAGAPAPDRGYSAPRPSSPSSPTADLLQITQGDAVRHKTFGKGMVLSIRKMGNDALIEVAFEEVGTKKLMLRAAGPHMTKV
jgi:DNA helicase-2/ATP-dependent DNA helicase PcrA